MLRIEQLYPLMPASGHEILIKFCDMEYQVLVTAKRHLPNNYFIKIRCADVEHSFQYATETGETEKEIIEGIGVLAKRHLINSIVGQLELQKQVNKYCVN